VVPLEREKENPLLSTIFGPREKKNLMTMWVDVSMIVTI
jgi:hypothetical protein